MSGRTSAWRPSSSQDTPDAVVALTPGDVVYYFLALLIKDVEDVKGAVKSSDRAEKVLMEVFACVLVNHDFARLLLKAQRVVR